MGSGKCFVYGCRTGYESDIKKRKAEGKKSPSLFSPPRDEVKLQKWRIAIRRSDRALSRTDKVCELHFLPEEISRHYIHKMPDGTDAVIERGRPSLVADAVPSIFSFLPTPKNYRKTKPPAKRMPLAKESKRENIPAEDVNIVDHTMPPFPISSLIKDILDVRKPNKFWSVSSHEDFIVCVKWDANFASEKKIIIDADLGIKIMYYGSIASNKPNLTVNSVDSLSQLILEVDKYMVCPGAINGNENCLLCVEREWGACGRPYKWCSECRKNISKLRYLEQKNPELALKNKRLYQ